MTASAHVNTHTHARTRTPHARAQRRTHARARARIDTQYTRPHARSRARTHARCMRTAHLVEQLEEEGLLLLVRLPSQAKPSMRTIVETHSPLRRARALVRLAQALLCSAQLGAARWLSGRLYVHGTCLGADELSDLRPALLVESLLPSRRSCAHQWCSHARTSLSSGTKEHTCPSLPGVAHEAKAAQSANFA
jgi:hypothetical protein